MKVAREAGSSELGSSGLLEGVVAVPEVEGELGERDDTDAGAEGRRLYAYVTIE